jgi:hypothetical protein
VAELTSRIYVHTALRPAACVLCGGQHDQQYIATGLFDGDRHLGDLCPRCILAGPVECAGHVRERAQRAPKRAGANNRLRIYQPLDVAETRPPKKKPFESGAYDPGPQGAIQLPPTRAELLGLADALTLLKVWPTSIADMQEAEKVALRRRFPLLNDEDLSLLVDERYLEFFEEEPEVDPQF